MPIISNIISLISSKLLGGLPACVRDLLVANYPSLNNIINDEVIDTVGVRDDNVYYGQYLSSGTINFYRTSGTFDYIDPSDGSLVEGVSIPGTGLYTVPVNGICDIGVYGEETVSGLLDFDGIDDVVSFVSIPDITGNKTISFKMYITDLVGYHGVLISIKDDPNDILYIEYNGSLACYAYTGIGTNARRTYDLTGLDNTLLDVVIVKSAQQILSVTINETESTTPSTSGVGITGSGFAVGSYYTGSLFTSDILIWDVNINDAHAYAGQPSGNLDSAWVDSVGSINGVVNGSPTTTSISYVSESTPSSVYPVCERAGTVLHDIGAGIHISVSTPVWAEELYGSDWLNQYGFTVQQDYIDNGLTWESAVDGSNVALDANTLVPAIDLSYIGLPWSLALPF